MKKLLIILFILFSFSLFGCAKKESNITIKQIKVKDFYTKEVIDAIDTKISMNHKTLKHDVEIFQKNAFMITFVDHSVYHIPTDKFLTFDKTLVKNVWMFEEYLYVEFDDKYEAYNYKTGKRMFEFVISPDKDYDFYNDLIIEHEKVEDVFTEIKRYEFRAYELLEEPDKKDPLKSFEFYTFKDFQYSDNNDGITIFKDNKFYDYYAFEPYLEDWFFLENGNFLFLYVIPLPNESIEYDYLEGSQKRNYHYILYNVAKKKIERIELDILLKYVLPKNEIFPFGFDNFVAYQKIDKQTKMLLDKPIQGAINNDLNTLYPLEFEFGIPRNIIPLYDNLFAVQTEYGMILINEKNKVLNQLLFDKNKYNVNVYKNATVMLTASNEVYLYNLKTGELIKGGLNYTFLSAGAYILKDEDNEKYYLFSGGELLQLSGNAERILGYFYKVEQGTSSSYYYMDNTLLFSTDDLVISEQIHDEYHSTRPSIYTYLFTYTENGRKVYEVVRVIIYYPEID